VTSSSPWRANTPGCSVATSRAYCLCVAVDVRATRHDQPADAQTRGQVFGWMKTIALQRKTRFRGSDRTGWIFHISDCRLQPGENAESSNRNRLRRSAREARTIGPCVSSITPGFTHLQAPFGNLRPVEYSVL
jgi:hypothetical protein